MTAMKRLRRRVVLALVVIFVVGLVLFSAASLWLSLWISTKGKAWLEAQLEQRLPVDVTIDTLRYELGKGLVLERVSAVELPTSTLWFYAQRLEARVGLLGFLIRQDLAFRLTGPVEAPCPMELLASGRYRIRSQQLRLDVSTSEIPIEGVIPQLARYLPSALKGGSVRMKVRAHWQPEQEPVITGRLTGTALLWQQDTVRITSNLTVEGRVTPTTQRERPLATDLTIRIEQGSLEGLPGLASASPAQQQIVYGASDISGVMRLTDDVLAITRLSGVTFESPWEMEGEVTRLADPHADVRLSTRVDLAMVAPHLPPQVRSWQPSGNAAVTVVCRGPLARWPHLELMGKALLEDASLAIPNVPHRLEQVTGQLQYDHLTRHLTLESFTGRVRDSPVTLEGSLQLATPAVLDLKTHTTADLALLQDLLPAEGPIHTLAGGVSMRLHVRGTTVQPTWEGVATLTDARLSLRGLPQPLEDLHGTIRFTNEELATSSVSFTVDQHPISLSGSVTNLATAPRIVCKAQVADGTIALTGTLHPDRVVVETSELALGRSHVRLRGQVSRLPTQPSQLTAAGTIELADLARIPWVDLKFLEPWRLDGEIALQLRLSGSLTAWHTMAALGSIRADVISLYGLPVRALNAALEQEPDRLLIRLTHATVAGGKVAGVYAIQHRPEAGRYRLELDAMTVDLAQLATSFPAWRGRRIEGTASAHTSLTGSWKDRTTLQGEGWLHAAGEHLGELPLLDRLFRGVLGALADRLGLVTLRKAELTKLAGQWRLAHERLATDDLRLTGVSGTDPVTISVRGSVGLDKTLDLVVEPDLSEQLLVQATTLSGALLKVVGGLERIRQLVGRHRLLGTIDKPEYKFEFSLDQLLNQLLSSGFQQLLPPTR
jgi:hypothetical protein